MAITRLPQGYFTQGQVTCFSAYKGSTTLTAGSDYTTLAQWIMPFDCEVLKCDYEIVLAAASGTHAVRNLDLQADIPTAGTLATITTAVSVSEPNTAGTVATFLPTATAKYLPAGTIVHLHVQDDADSNITMDSFTATLVVRPLVGV